MHARFAHCRWALPVVGLTLCLLGRAPAWAGDDENEKPARQPEIRVLFQEGPKLATMRFGILLPPLAVPRSQTFPYACKQLTFSPTGITNNTCVKLDGEECLLGSEPGKWLTRKAPLGKGRQGLRSVWVYPDEKVHVTQTVEVVRGEQTGNVDTCRVGYLLENRDNEEHTVGLRFLLDTLVGSNDGAPFIIPGRSALCETSADFKGADRVPVFVQALERLDFKKPGVVAHLQLKVPGLEPPGRVTLGAWPDQEALKGFRGARGTNTLWNVPVASFQDTHDSAAVLYWAEKKLPAGARREVGFTYGLGNFAGDRTGKLGLILAGPFQAGGNLTVLALVKGPEEDQTVTLKFPPELPLAKGEKATKTVALPAEGGSDVTAVTWTLRTPQEGTFAFRVESSTGARYRQGVRINPKAGAEKEAEEE